MGGWWKSHHIICYMQAGIRCYAYIWRSAVERECMQITHMYVNAWYKDTFRLVDTHTCTRSHTRAVIEAGEIGENYAGEKVWPISPPALCAQINPQPLLEQMNYYFVLCVQQHPYWCQKMTWFVFFFFFFFLLCCSFFLAEAFHITLK